MSLDAITLNKDKSLIKNSDPEKIDKDQMYKISAKVIGKSGKPFCGYIGIVFLENNIEIERKINWLNDFSGQTKTHQVVFKAITSEAMIIYRINNETPIKTECNFKLTPIKDITIERTTDTQEKYDKIEDYTIPRPRELSEEEEDRVEKNIVWVLGSPRGGTTWVGTQLLSYNTNIIDEFSISPHIGSLFNTRQGQSSRYIDFKQKDSQFYIFAKQYTEIWSYYLRKLILNRIFAQFPDATEKITVIKEPDVIGIPDVISKCLPNSKIIFLIRDGRDVIDSSIAARGKEGFMAKKGLKQLHEIDERLNFIKRRSGLWVEMVQNMLNIYEKHSKDKMYKVRYEDILKNPNQITKQFYNFIGIKISEDKINKIVEKYAFENIPEKLRGEGKFYRSASPGKWREHLNEEERDAMNKIMNETLRKLDYQI